MASPGPAQPLRKGAWPKQPPEALVLPTVSLEPAQTAEFEQYPRRLANTFSKNFKPVRSVAHTRMASPFGTPP